MARGWFITFEGSEGCGKSTQIRLLCEALRRQGHEVVETREPGGTPLGETIRHLLKFAPEGNGMYPETELLLFAASRAQLVRQVIAPALGRGAVVVADRFHDSTTVYQGVARALDPAQVENVNKFATGTVLPDLTLLLDLPAEEARARLKLRAGEEAQKDRMEQEPEAFYEAVREGYLRLAEAEPKRIRVINASGAPAEIFDRIKDVVQEACNGILP
jgi:dTMP kinase